MVTIYFYQTIPNGETDKLIERQRVDTKEHAIQFLNKKKYRKAYDVYLNRVNPRLYAVIDEN